MWSPWESVGGGGGGKSAGKKDNFELFHIFKEVLGLLASEESLSWSTFQVKARLYENFIAVRK